MLQIKRSYTWRCFIPREMPLQLVWSYEVDTLEHVLWAEECQTKATDSEKRGRNSRSFEAEHEPTKTMEASISQ
jgi:hypothetical protein